ncbi:MAG: elongation factor G [Desulfoplanes sp.]|nr:elongation factor G [Desulfoplanes sp.]
MVEKLRRQRTYALVGHGGTGKTSVAEMILLNAGTISRLGKVEEGTTCLDYEPEEIKRRGSIQPAVACYEWQKNAHFLLDTPGDNNFIGDLSYQLLAADSAVFVIDAIDGVKPLTKKLWGEVLKADLPAMVFINKLDRERADFESAYNSLSSILGIKTVLLNIPIGAETDFRGIVDILQEKAFFFQEDGTLKEDQIPPEMQDNAAMIREVTVENIAETDEELMEKYLEEGILTLDEIISGLRKGIASREIIPVCVGSALMNRGGVQLLNAIQDLMPSPLQHPEWAGENGDTRVSDPDQPFAGFVFKTIADPFAGQLNMVRVLSGTVSSDMNVINTTRDGKEKFGQILLPEGKKQNPCKTKLGPGAIFALAKLKNTSTGDTLCAEKAPFLLAKPTLPPTIISYALNAAEKGEEDKVFAAVQRLLEEDILLSLSRNEETGDMLLSGMGQLHIELSVEKIKRRYKADIILKTPKIPYRETIKGSAEVQGRHKKQSGGRGQFGDCWIKMEPNPGGNGYEFINAVVGGSIPKQYIPAVDKGVQEAAARGVLAGYPMIDFKVTLYDGSYHAVDSSEMAFKVAGSLAFKKAAEQCSPVLLEPIMHTSVFVPDEYMGDVIGDLSGRRGRVSGSDSDKGITVIQAHVPLSEILKYAPDLRSMTGGQGTFTMEFDHYEECPAQITEKVIAESQQKEA